MKRSASFYFIALVILIAQSGCNQIDCISGSGNEVTQSRKLDSFTFIETGGSIKLVLKQGPVQDVRIVADDNIQEEITTRVNGKTLKIELEGNLCDSGPITAYITAPAFEGVDASGAVELNSDGNLKVNNFEIHLSGSSKVNLDLNAANVLTTSSGSSEIYLKGQAGTHEVDLSGAGSIEALDFIVGKYKIESSGASKSRINVLNELRVKSSGASDVQYRGNPTSVSNNDSGASSLKKIN
ncbi:head GIN domain-containing protein [Daejeonella oryzae]|uniref:head GIN domain-containing protein n=1 Tax=Daejeonella oryzae TaxID=1122943 RepID=UPI000417D0C5|nr:head GIN domain-containing protein [Daejeonella oryzae]